MTSNYCSAEARENLSRKAPRQLPRFRRLLKSVAVVPAPAIEASLSHRGLPTKDLPVLAAAIAASADVLITGDLRHFGHLMKRKDLGIRVCTIREFLLEGPG